MKASELWEKLEAHLTAIDKRLDALEELALDLRDKQQEYYEKISGELSEWNNLNRAQELRVMREEARRVRAVGELLR